MYLFCTNKKREFKNRATKIKGKFGTVNFVIDQMHKQIELEENQYVDVNIQYDNKVLPMQVNSTFENLVELRALIGLTDSVTSKKN